MAIYRSSDSLSRCDPNQYSSIYDVGKRPKVKPEVVSAPPIHKDSMEISRDKLKEEALSRLRHTSKYVIAQQGFMRIGKYLFLAVALPPYFAIYGLPKWIVVEGLPSLFAMSMWIWKKIQHQTQKQIEVGSRKVVQMVQFVHRLGQVIMQPVVHLVLQIRRNISRLSDRALRFLKPMAAKAKHIANFSRLAFSAKLQLRDMRESLLKIKESWLKQKKKVALSIEQGIRWLKETPQLVLGWGQVQFQRLNQQMLILGLQWKNRLQTSQQFAQRATHWVSHQFEKGWKGLSHVFRPVKDLYQQYGKLHWQRFRKSWQKISQFMQSKHQQAWCFLQMQQEKLHFFSLERFLRYITAHRWMKKLPLHLQLKVKEFFNHPVMRVIGRWGIASYAFLAHALLQVAKYGLLGLANGSAWTNKGSTWLRHVIYAAFKQLHSILRIVKQKVFNILHYALYYFLLFLTISLVLFVWALALLREYTHSFLASLYIGTLHSTFTKTPRS